MISRKPMQLGLPNFTQKRSTMSHGWPGNPFVPRSKGQRSRWRCAKNSVGVGFCTLASARFFKLLSSYWRHRFHTNISTTKHRKGPQLAPVTGSAFSGVTWRNEMKSTEIDSALVPAWRCTESGVRISWCRGCSGTCRTTVL